MVLTVLDRRVEDAFKPAQHYAEIAAACRQMGLDISDNVTEFEKAVDEYKLTPDQYLQSSELREWARRNKNSKFIPEALLEAWGFEIEAPEY